MVHYYTRQQAAQDLKQTTEMVVKQFPTLKGQDSVVQAAISLLNSQGYQPTSPQEAVTAIGQAAGSLIQAGNPAFNLSNPQPQNGQSSVQPSPAPTMAGSGQQGVTSPPNTPASDGKPAYMNQVYGT